MKSEENVLGQLLWAYYQGKESSHFEIWERSDGYISVDLTKNYFSEYEDWALYQRKALEFVKGRVLDIGCGAGRHSLYLQDKGFDVLGIDISPLAIKVSRLRGLKKAEIMSIEDVNFRPNSFDTIIMMGNNFGLFGSFEKARKLLTRFHRMTSENALIIADTRNPYKKDPAHLEYRRLNEEKGRMGGQVKGRMRFEKYTGKWFDWLMVSKKEMKKILKGTGWKIRKFLDSEDSRYIAIIEKMAE